MSGKRNSGSGGSAQAAATALDRSQLEHLVEKNPAPEQFCAELAKVFHVRPTEVALLRLENGLLKFLFPDELRTAGTIPISSASAVAAHTAVTKKVELFNNFANVKHASIFETVRLADRDKDSTAANTIYKLMSAPVMDTAGKVMGVLQICRKGFDLSSAGPDFTLNDLQQLELAAKALAKAGFMRMAAEGR